jgi:hypothetical protein
MGRPAIGEQTMTAAERQRRHRKKLHHEEESDSDLFTMTNLYPRRTGLPMTVWVSPRGCARQAARIKVNMTHGNRMTIGNTAIVRCSPRRGLSLGNCPPPTGKRFSDGLR